MLLYDDVRKLVLYYRPFVREISPKGPKDKRSMVELNNLYSELFPQRTLIKIEAIDI